MSNASAAHSLQGQEELEDNLRDGNVVVVWK